MFRKLWQKLWTRAPQTSPSIRRSKKSRPRHSSPLLLEMLENRIVPAPFTGDTKDWMGLVPGQTLLNQMSIPGTHDTMTYAFHGTDRAPFAQTQDDNLATQLAKGIRFLDIRCGPVYAGDSLVTNDFGLYHGNYAIPGLFFDSSVLHVCQDFLYYHPGETIVMSIKNDFSGSSALTNEQFDAFFNNIWRGSEDSWYVGGTVPSLEEVRGKIVLLRR